MFEKPINRKEKPGTNKSREAAKALAILAAIVPTEMAPGSIEDISGLNWSKGVELLKENVMHGTHEAGAIFFINREGKGEWKTLGDPIGSDQIQQDIGTGTELMNKYDKENGPVERVCLTHTHPIGAVFQDVQAGGRMLDPLLGTEQIFYPPSEPDNSNLRSTRIMFGEEGIYDFVLEPNGGWYTRPATEVDFQDNPKIVAYFEKRYELDNLVFGGDNGPGLIEDSLAELNDEEIAKLLESVGGEVKKWSDLDERNDRELSIASILVELIEKHYAEIDLSPFLVNLGNEVNSTYDQAWHLRQQGKLIYSYAKAYGMFSNLPPNTNIERPEFIKEIDQYRSYYTQQYVEVFGKKPDLQNNLKRLLLEGLLLNNVKGRFVTYEQMVVEPPCSGPDYKSKQE